jgi:hypothetical protein
MGRSYMGSKSIYGCPVEWVIEWIHLVERGGKPWNAGKFSVG